MVDYLDVEGHRPAKRIKLEPPYHNAAHPRHPGANVQTNPQPPLPPNSGSSPHEGAVPQMPYVETQQYAGMPPQLMDGLELSGMNASFHSADENRWSPAAGENLFDPRWSWPESQSAGEVSRPPQVGHDIRHTTAAPWPHLNATVGIPISPMTMSTALPYTGFETTPSTDGHSAYLHGSQFEAPSMSRTGSHVQSSGRLKRPSMPSPLASDAAKANIARRQVIPSPFRDCLGTFGTQKSRLYMRPSDGQVNGYIKFNWPKDKAKRASVVRSASVSEPPRVTELADDGSEINSTTQGARTELISTSASPNIHVLDGINPTQLDLSNLLGRSSFSSYEINMPRGVSMSPTMASDSTALLHMGSPRQVPSQYGYEAKMDATDRKFWEFYINNWCPGRSVLSETNLWLKDFAQMHKSDGVRAAIQSLAGIYIYDYQPIEAIRNRVNQRFADAEARFTDLLNDPVTGESEDQANELITIAAVLSMQDIVLTERRRKKLEAPRWLEGFRQGERFLQATDKGLRFWKSSNVQLTSLRNSQSVIVGRAVILAQPLCALPAPHQFDAEREAARFGWLLYGTEKDMYQIHGGCGFSKRLLHILSQVTYCAARLQQEQESPIVPMTADYLYKELNNMRQWSSESKDWDIAKTDPPTVAWIQQQPLGYRITSNEDMTDVTAESWRLTAVLYLQARVLRLPRNHPDVMGIIEDLANCIAVMPTSGTHFTAQAPLFPVFLLGIMSATEEHRAVSRNWFDEVLRTPVRSSVPPLFAALQQVWGWIDNVIPCPADPVTDAEQPIHQRRAWWEELVHRVLRDEQEILCLT